MSNFLKIIEDNVFFSFIDKTKNNTYVQLSFKKKVWFQNHFIIVLFEKEIVNKLKINTLLLEVHFSDLILLLNC